MAFIQIPSTIIQNRIESNGRSLVSFLPLPMINRCGFTPSTIVMTNKQHGSVLKRKGHLKALQLVSLARTISERFSRPGVGRDFVDQNRGTSGFSPISMWCAIRFCTLSYSICRVRDILARLVQSLQGRWTPNFGPYQDSWWATTPARTQPSGMSEQAKAPMPTHEGYREAYGFMQLGQCPDGTPYHTTRQEMLPRLITLIPGVPWPDQAVYMSWRDRRSCPMEAFASSQSLRRRKSSNLDSSPIDRTNYCEHEVFCCIRGGFIS